MTIRNWLKDTLDAAAVKYATSKRVVKDKDGVETIEERQLKRREIDFNKLFDIALENGVDGAKVEEARGYLDVKNGPGRARMTIGNLLYTQAVKNGNVTIDGTAQPVPGDLLSAHRAESEAKEAERKNALAAKKEQARAAREAAKPAETAEVEAGTADQSLVAQEEPTEA